MILTDKQIANTMRVAGWPENELETGIAVCLAESSGNTEALNASGAAGLWQILRRVHTELFAIYQWDDPVDNAKMALSVFSAAGNSWHPWTTYNSGSYLRYINRAKEAIMTSVKPPAPLYAGPPHYYSAGDNAPYNRVVIHSAVTPCIPGESVNIAALFRNGNVEGSAHYTIDPTETRQAAWDHVICWHAPPNQHSLGIEMADTPGPVPNDPPGSAKWKAAKRSWRWIRPNQQRMLKRTAHLTAHLCAAYDIPPVFLTVKDLHAGKRGVTTHANVSKTWHESTHWDPGFWPRRAFMFMVMRHYNKLVKK